MPAIRWIIAIALACLISVGCSFISVFLPTSTLQDRYLGISTLRYWGWPSMVCMETSVTQPDSRSDTTGRSTTRTVVTKNYARPWFITMITNGFVAACLCAIATTAFSPSSWTSAVKRRRAISKICVLMIWTWAITMLGSSFQPRWPLTRAELEAFVSNGPVPRSVSAETDSQPTKAK